MILKKLIPLVFSFCIIILNIPTTSAVGDYTIEISMNDDKIIFQENQESQTVIIDGFVNYTGASVMGDTVKLSCDFELGESSVSPEEVTFYTTGSEEFTLELIIPNIYENGTRGDLMVVGEFDGEGGPNSITVITFLTIINYTSENHVNLTEPENNKKGGNFPVFDNIWMISIIIIIITIIAVIIYKKNN
jgi:hypothetical protein